MWRLLQIEYRNMDVKVKLTVNRIYGLRTIISIFDSQLSICLLILTDFDLAFPFRHFLH